VSFFSRQSVPVLFASLVSAGSFETSACCDAKPWSLYLTDCPSASWSPDWVLIIHATAWWVFTSAFPEGLLIGFLLCEISPGVHLPAARALGPFLTSCTSSAGGFSVDPGD